jgi:hypothetical protein
MLEIVREAAERVGGVNELAQKLGVSRQALYQWAEVPVERARDLERVSGISRRRLRPDVFGGEPHGREPGYDDDFSAWAIRQAELLAARRFGELDLPNLIEEIEELSKAEKREIASRLGILLAHLLKFQYQPKERSRSWTATILEARARIARRIQDSPSLRDYPGAVLETEYALARKFAAVETGLDIGTFPETCPYTISQVLDLDFLP